MTPRLVNLFFMAHRCTIMRIVMGRGVFNKARSKRTEPTSAAAGMVHVSTFIHVLARVYVSKTSLIFVMKKTTTRQFKFSRKNFHFEIINIFNHQLRKIHTHTNMCQCQYSFCLHIDVKKKCYTMKLKFRNAVRQ